MNDLQHIEKNLHQALNDKEKVQMELEKERLRTSQLNFEVDDLKQQISIKSHELERLMNEKLKLNMELNESNRDKVDSHSKQDKPLVFFNENNKKDDGVGEQKTRNKHAE